ncbi:MAG TPA: HD domain-containing protein [Saprospiraceae bacterium]|nr:HD domain-containing protein [Saprospiraceae bacterium]HOY14239.1 HD domain-containing protein [Saprospiraceae bacterium]HPN71907.1 HD domain-containing protein [Saprospiraceae bacterium]
MVFNIDPEERKLFNFISEVAGDLGYPAYIVGGYVRDRLLARPTKDIDIVCVGDGIVLAEAAAQKLHPVPKVTVFKRFGTAMLRYHGVELEFVGARKESYSLDSRKPSVESGSLEDDQNRRDFTINALAISLNPDNFGEIIDPFNGLHHLTTKSIKTPLEPGKTFSDDPLRIMRAIRFATQLDFEIEPHTFKALSTYKSRLRIISKERITTELEKIMAAHKPSTGFKMLMDTGILELIFPELYALRGVEIREGIGHKDNFYHTLEVLDNVAAVSQNVWLRWAALLHDIAKPPTKRFEKGIGWTFHGHEALGAVMVAKIFRYLKLPQDHKMKYVQKLVKLHLRPIALTKEEITDSAVRRLIFEAGEDIDDLMILCKADITSKNQNKVDRYRDNYDKLIEKIAEIEESDRMRNWQPPISGEDIMKIFNLRPSREVGILKTAIREAILDGDIQNDYEQALVFLIEKAKEMGINVP